MNIVWKNESVLKLLNSHIGDDPLVIIRELSRQLVVEAYDKGWSGPPFDPIKLAKLLEHSILPNESVVDARIFGDNNTYTIEYNPNRRESRINFSVAHEIAHTLFPDCADQIRNREKNNENSNWELEFLCNVAASEILLPYAEFSAEVNSIPMNLDSILQIANKYKASVESVMLRFCEVSERSCAIIISSFTNEAQNELQVDYSKSTKTSSLNIDKSFIIPKESKAYECLNPGWTSHATEQWNIFGNTRYNVYSIGLPALKRQNNARVGSLIVPEFYSDELDTNIYIVSGDATKPRGNGNKIIAQVINTSGGLGFGFGRAMSRTWPKSKKAVLRWKEDRNSFILGESRLTQLSDDTYVFQMIAQKGIFSKNDNIPLRYDSLKECLVKLADEALRLGADIHMPKIGAGQAGGSWSIIEGMIYEFLIAKGINVTIYILPGSRQKKSKTTSNLTLFNLD